MYTVVSLNVDLAGEPDTIDFTLALFFYQFCSCFIHLCELSRSVFTLTRAHITHVHSRWWRNKAGFVRFIPALHGIETLSPFFCLPPFFFCLAELQFREPFPPRLHVFLGGFLRRGWLQHKIGIGVPGTRGYFTLEPAQTWAFQEKNPRRVCAGPRGESRAQDRRWAAASRLSFASTPTKYDHCGLPTVSLFRCPSSSYCDWVCAGGPVGYWLWIWGSLLYVMVFWCTLVLDMMPEM